MSAMMLLLSVKLLAKDFCRPQFHPVCCKIELIFIHKHKLTITEAMAECYINKGLKLLITFTLSRKHKIMNTRLALGEYR